MARKDLTIIIDADGRDKDKVFKIVEMSADQAERWAIRALLAVARANPDLGDLKDIESLGWQGIAKLGLQFIAGLDFEVAAPLLDEMMTCVSIIPNPQDIRITRALFPGDIEEVATRIKLRAEVFNLHVDFSALAAQFGSTTTAAGDQKNTPNTKTSRRR